MPAEAEKCCLGCPLISRFLVSFLFSHITSSQNTANADVPQGGHELGAEVNQLVGDCGILKSSNNMFPKKPVRNPNIRHAYRADT